MGTDETSRIDGWQAPARPEWVQRINEEGAGLDLRSVVPLDENSLIDCARQNTGLDDFGADDWHEPFQVMLKALNEEADLNLMGRLMTRSDILMLLEGRLRVEDMYRRHPEIDEQVIDQPFWIVGQGRSGTSILQKLLGMDPDNRPVMTDDSMMPVPQGPRTRDGRHPQFATVDHRMRMWNRVTPTVVTVHDFGGDEPIETILAEAMSFQCSAWISLFGLMPSYSAYIENKGHTGSLAYGKRVFKLLQWQRPGGRWVLKHPDSTRFLPQVMQVYPDARLVWSHRDPIKSMSSAVNLIGTLMWIRSDQRIVPGVWESLTDPAVAAQKMTQPIDWLESGVIPRSQFCNIQFKDLMADPVAAIEAMYGYFGLTMGEAGKAAIRGYFADHPQSARPAHVYSTGEQARIDKERTHFKRYEDYFKVPREV